MAIRMRTLIDDLAGYTEPTFRFAEQLDKAVPLVFNFPFPLVVFDNERVEESKHKTPEEIDALNKAMVHEIERAILADHYYDYLFTTNIERFRETLYAHILKNVNEWSDKFQIYSDKYQWRTFYDYDIHHDGTITGDTDNTASATSVGSSNTVSKAGDYPNDDTYEDAFATAKSTNDTESTGHNDSMAHEDSITHDVWREYRIGATGKTPVDVQIKAFENVQNIVGDIVKSFEKFFYFDYDLEDFV